MDSKAAVIGPDAPVLSLDEFRKARKQRRASLNLTRPLVAVWFGAAAIAAAAVIWTIMGIAMRHGLVGLAVLLAVGAAIAWPAAGSYVHKMRGPSRSRAESRSRHPSANPARRP